MESLKSFHDRLKKLQSQGKKLIEARLALNSSFAEEETRLKREDEASILKVVRCAIVEELQRLKHAEALASHGHSQANLILLPVGLIVTAMVSRGNRLSAITDYLLRGSADRQQPFGLVMVCIGPNGLPDDARGVSISRLARESHRPEPDIMNTLEGDGSLLFSREAFSLLIERLMGAVREGKLHLPISRDELVEITGLGKPKRSIKVIEVK